MMHYSLLRNDILLTQNKRCFMFPEYLETTLSRNQIKDDRSKYLSITCQCHKWKKSTFNRPAITLLSTTKNGIITHKMK